ncbi:MAG TPA: polymer-forming cytoskeletal protein [Candidatus Acidoferrales bacterium]|nr:polymer-forming cytoskeletal protein [Candidatus Acidoferrales bacterium]
MWRKTTEAQPSSPVSGAPVSIKPQDVPQTPASRVPSQSVPASSPSASEAAAAAIGRGTSRIASGLKIQGEFSGSSDLYIEGEVQGRIRLANARVTVGPNGRVQADIEAREIFVDGSVQGSLKASERAHFGSSSRVVGSVLTPRIGIDDGARLRGKVETVPASPVRESSASKGDTESEALQPVAASLKGE